MSPSQRSAEFKSTGLIGTFRSCQFFAGLPAGDINALAALARMIRLPKGATLFREGDPSIGFYLVQTGAVNVHRVNAGGKEQVIHVFRAGESFAEGALASPTGYPATARAVEPTTVLLMPKEPVLELIGRRPDLAMRMLASMSVHLRVLVGALDDLTLKNVETRVLNWLVKGGRASRNGIVAIGGTKRVLAAELGTSSETLSRTLARLRDRQLISVGDRAITIRDQGGLETLLKELLGES